MQATGPPEEAAPAAKAAQPHEGLQLQLSAQASELQSSEAAVEYVQRLLNAMTAENGDLRKQLVKYRASEQTERGTALQHASFTGKHYAVCSKCSHGLSVLNTIDLQELHRSITACLAYK